MYQLGDETYGKDRHSALLQEAEARRLHRRIKSRQACRLHPVPTPPMHGGLFYYLDLYGTYLKLYGKTLLQYRADLGVLTGAMVISEGAQLLFITIIFSNIPALQGWTFHEVLLMYGLRVAAGGLNVALLNMPWALAYWTIRTGTLDAVLVRPPAPLFQLIGQNCLAPHAFGRMIIGLAALVLALQELHAQVQLWWVVYIPLVLMSGTLLSFSLLLILACLSFWFTHVSSILFPVGWFSLFAEYPVAIYAPPLQFVLTWVIPYAMSSFYPVAFLLRGPEYQFYGLLAPLMGFLFLGLALGVWRFALSHYHSTGS